ncbi:MAG: LytR family transcriptional regulator [Chloroflexi bacterium]|nr:MAG: LytR family transcriptional regulator [Chloroflexota bacterium]TMF00256.1 MAG: LytR family transcriptional regulator [Chloroflexota bacterium]
MGDFSARGQRLLDWRHAIPLPRPWRVIAGFLLAGLIGLTAYFLPLFQSASTPIATSGGGLINPVSGPTDPFTVLLLGSDDDSKFPGDQFNTQSMILVRVDPINKQATMMSIPRDLWAPIEGQRYMGKISTAYQTGGVQATIATVEQNFHVRVDDYIWIGLAGLIKLIDTLGGVNLVVTNPVMDDFYPADINTSSPYGYYRVALLPGPVHLDGVQALQYVRSRHGDIRGDFARSERQQQLLLAMKAQSKHINLADFPDIASALNGEVRTSISLERARQLYSVLDQFDSAHIKRILLGAPYTSEGWAGDQSVVYPNWGQILPLVSQYFAQ